MKRGDPIAWLDKPPRRTRCRSSQHLHLQLSNTVWRADTLHRDPAKNPHLFRVDGSYRPTCFDPEREYPEGTITYPLMCDWQVFTVDDVLERMAGETDEAASRAD